MKKAFIAFIALTSTASYANNCDVVLKSNGPSGPVLKDEVLEKLVSKKLKSKGYNVVRGQNTAFEFIISYIGHLNERGSSTAGAAIKMIDVNMKSTLGAAQEELGLKSFLPFMTGEKIAKSAVEKATDVIVKTLVPCKELESKLK